MNIRSLVRDWRFTLFVLLILAAGIGLNAAMFSLVDAILFRPFPAFDGERLVRIFRSTPDGKELGGEMSYPVYRDYVEQSRSFRSLAAFATDITFDAALGGKEAERVAGALATGSFFETVGVRAQRGRMFGPEDDRPGNAVTVISDRLWRNRFDASDSVIGRNVRINATTFTIVGVAPAGFDGVTLEAPADLWVPVSMCYQAAPAWSGIDMLGSRGFSWLNLIGRLRDNVTARQAEAELRLIAARRAATQVENPDPSATIVGAAEAALDLEGGREVRKLASLMLLFVGLVLLIACVNAGSLQLVRGERRQRELAIRAAIGASRARIVTQLAVESLVLAVAAGALGIAIANVALRAFTAVAPEDFPLVLHAARPVLDVHVLLVTLGLTMISAMIFGVAPALRASRVDVVGTIKGEQQGPRGASLRGALVIVQIALSVILLVFAGLLLRTVWAVGRIDSGLRLDGVVVATLDVARQGYDETRGRRFFDELRARLSAVPSVESAALMRSVPVNPRGMRTSIIIPGVTLTPGVDDQVVLNIATPGAFRALGVPVLHGRDFTEADMAPNAPAVAIVNEAFARHYFKTPDAVGRQMTEPMPLTIVGVVKTTKIHSMREDPLPALIVPPSLFYMPGMTVLLRTNGDPSAAMALLRSTVRNLDPNLPLFHVRTLREHAGRVVQKERVLAMLLIAFGVLALVLAAAGLFSVISYRTEVRRREIGIRIAIGAERRDIRRLLMGHTLMLVAVGAAIGAAAAAMLTRVITTLLYGVAPNDPLTFAGVIVLLFLTGIAATIAPLRRALRIDPARALRYE